MREHCVQRPRACGVRRLKHFTSKFATKPIRLFVFIFLSRFVHDELALLYKAFLFAYIACQHYICTLLWCRQKTLRGSPKLTWVFLNRRRAGGMFAPPK